MKKITKATIKSFLRKNQGKVYCQTLSYFDGQIDGTTYCKESEWKLTDKADAAMIDIMRNYFSPYEDKDYIGYNVYNCCGNYNIAIRKGN